MKLAHKRILAGLSTVKGYTLVMGISLGLLAIPTWATSPEEATQVTNAAALTDKAATNDSTEKTTVERSLTRVSLNSANADVLAANLVGIGKAKAEAIIHWRDTHGRFEKVEQLLEVKGIGKATLEKNKTRITL